MNDLQVKRNTNTKLQDFVDKECFWNILRKQGLREQCQNQASPHMPNYSNQDGGTFFDRSNPTKTNYFYAWTSHFKCDLAKMNKMDVFVGLQNKCDFNCCNIVSIKRFAWDYRQLVMMAT